MTAHASRRRFVLLHGLAGSAQMWQPLAERLEPYGEVLAVTLPWNGAAEQSWAWELDPGRALAGTFTGNDVVVAHSFSAALLLAEITEGRVDPPAGAVLVSPFYRPTARDFTWGTLAHYLADFHLLLADGVRASSRRDIPDDLLHDMAVAVRDRVGAYGWIRFFEAYLATPSLAVHRLTAPVSIVHGADDGVAPPEDATALHARLSDSDLTLVPRAGHFPMLLAPDALAGAVVDLLGRLRVPTPSQEVPV